MQARALVRAAARQLRWGLPAVSAELRRWRRRALAIPDERLRADALHALDSKRGHTDGAALFWTLTERRDPALLRLLVTYEVAYDYLDNVSERYAAAGDHHGHRLFRALVEAVEPDGPRTDYYAHDSSMDDGGYLRALVDESRAGCSHLPAFSAARPFIEKEASNTQVLAMNHIVDPARRDAVLEAWAANRGGDDEHGMTWYEATAAASQSVVTFALLAAAADHTTTPAAAAMVYDAYVPWFAYAVTMLDSFVDEAEDAHAGAHSYVSHYDDAEIAVARLCESARRSAEQLLALPHGERHAVLLGCMIAMYLSKDSARVAGMSERSARIVRAGGTLTALLLPILRLWRIGNGQKTST